MHFYVCLFSPPGSMAKHLESANTMFSFIWWIIGFYWVSADGQALLQDSPQLYWFVLSLTHSLVICNLFILSIIIFICNIFSFWEVYCYFSLLLLTEYTCFAGYV